MGKTDVTICDNEIFTEFIDEAQEGILKLERELSFSTNEHLTKEQVDEVMRIMHTMKGTSGFVGMANLTQLTHQMEDLMINLRDGVLQFSKPLIDMIFKGIDYSRKIVERASMTAEENQLTEEEEQFLLIVTSANEVGFA